MPDVHVVRVMDRCERQNTVLGIPAAGSAYGNPNRSDHGSSNRRIIGDIPPSPRQKARLCGGQRVGVIRTEHPLLRGEQPVEFGDRAGDSPHPAGSPAARPRSILGRVNVAVPTCVVLTRALSSRLSRVA